MSPKDGGVALLVPSTSELDGEHRPRAPDLVHGLVTVPKENRIYLIPSPVKLSFVIMAMIDKLLLNALTPNYVWILIVNKIESMIAMSTNILEESLCGYLHENSLNILRLLVAIPLNGE